MGKEEIKKTIEQKEKELNKLKKAYQESERIEKLNEKAREYFSANFEMNMSHNISAIDEYWRQLMNRFVDRYCEDDESMNQRNLMTLRGNYVELVKDELDTLQKQYELLVGELEKAKVKK